MNNYQESAECSNAAVHGEPSSVRAIIKIAGNVQGVGFRPFLYRLATEHGLRGSVANSTSGVDVEIEGPQRSVKAFLTDIPQRCPSLATITELNHCFSEPVGHSAFVIAGSHSDEHRTAFISPDVAVCDDCLRELFDPGDRRYGYPFINCTNCGPRYTIIADVPYDRATTSMACFAMCSACQAEYDDPTDRRFHAQPNACPDCGPRVWLVDDGHDSRRPGNDAIEEAARLLQQGGIVGVKGLGGFHLACDATNAQAVELLRQRKQREEKPFALMVPDLETARQLCHLDAGAESVIAGRERPITLLPRRADALIADAVAPGNNELGLMLPYTPLHYLLLFDKAGEPRFRALVMTSGNLSDEPIAIGNREALQRLGTIADAFLLHDRDILIRADDSVVRCVSVASPALQQSRTTHRQVTMIRRSRGYVPAPIFLDRNVGEVLAVGGHLKNTVAISRAATVFLSQHIGDLENLETMEFLKQSVDHLQRILGIRPAIVAHDLHPDYLSTRFARQFEDVQLVPVQHHHAHVAACMAEHGLDGPVIGVALDGTGYGPNGHIWGGEVLISEYDGFQRLAHLREVPMPGNDQAIRQPWRMALSWLDAAFGDRLWSLPIPFVRHLDRPRAELLLRAARKNFNSPRTSSCGRLFDAVAALTGLRQTVSFEGQAAMEFEMAMGYQLALTEESKTVRPDESVLSSEQSSLQPFVVDPLPLVRAVVAEIRAGVPPAIISHRFHVGLVQLLARTVIRVSCQACLREVVLSGGCFQNRFLQGQLTVSLKDAGLKVYSHRTVPANDGGLALGQIMVASALNKTGGRSVNKDDSRG